MKHESRTTFHHKLVATAALFMCILFSSGQAMAQFSQRNSVLEVFSGAWCGWCPDGDVIRDDIVSTHGDQVIVVENHNGDSMTNPDAASIASFYASAYPSATIDRMGEPEFRNTWMATVNSQLQGVAYATIGITGLYDADTNQVNGVVSAQFTGTMAGDLRFGVMIVEDNVTGSGSGYDQANYLNNQPGHPFYQAGDPILGYNHRYVLRDTPLGPWGASGVIPSTVTFGSNYEQSYSYTVPASVDPTQLGAIGFVAEYNGNLMTDRPIVNAAQTQVLPVMIFASTFENNDTAEWSATTP